MSNSYPLAVPYPKAGDTWRSRDKRDNGKEVTVLEVGLNHVTIQRFRKTRVHIKNWASQYEFVRRP